jgi:hypothetical protein
MEEFVTESPVRLRPCADPLTAELAGRAAALLREFNEAAMTGPTLDPPHVAQALEGVIALVERLPNTLRHLSGHLLSIQRQGSLLDPLNRDTDELTERVRQRCHDAAEALAPIAVRLREARELVAPLTAAEHPIRTGVRDLADTGVGPAAAADWPGGLVGRDCAAMAEPLGVEPL